MQIPIFAQDEICGTYRNNVAQIGFFGETLTLNNDSTFKYSFSGDLIHREGKGTYKIKNKRITIHFIKKDYSNLDSLISIGKITSLALDSIMKPLLEQKEPDIDLLDSLSNLEQVDWFDVQEDSMVFIIKNKKLLSTNKNGKITRRVQAFSKRKKYFLWGEPYMKKRKYYLTKQ